MCMEVLLAAICGVLFGYLVRELLARRPWASGTREDVAQLSRRFDEVGAGMQHLTQLIDSADGGQRNALGEMRAMLQTIGDQTGALSSVMANSRLRGQWGERTAEDILRVAGFVEGVNYQKQKTLAESRSRPDFTFPLPNELVVNMDVKFPLENYARAVEATSDDERSRFEQSFLRDVRGRIREIATRDYVDPGNGTVDCVLMFIPSESVYAEISRLDPGVFRDAWEHRVVACSPMSLFGMLSVIRQAAESSALRQASGEVVSQLATFQLQWSKFTDELEKLGNQLDTSRHTYDRLNGPRRRQLERPLEQIEAIRVARNLAPANEDELALAAADDDDEPDSRVSR